MVLGGRITVYRRRLAGDRQQLPTSGGTVEAQVSRSPQCLAAIGIVYVFFFGCGCRTGLRGFVWSEFSTGCKCRLAAIPQCIALMSTWVFFNARCSVDVQELWLDQRLLFVSQPRVLNSPKCSTAWHMFLFKVK